MAAGVIGEKQGGLSVVRWLLHLEGIGVAAGALALYGAHGASPWWWVPALFLLPDLAFVIYAVNRKAGVLAYNIVHHYGWPVALGVVGLLNGWSVGVSIALIWAFHIGVDRGVGYGFKYGIGNEDTHIRRA